MNVAALRYALRLGSLALMLLLFDVADASAQCEYCPGGPSTFGNGLCTDAGPGGQGNTGCFEDWDPELYHHCDYNGDSCMNSPGGGMGGGEQQECYLLPWWLRWLNPHCGEEQVSLPGQLGTGLRRADASTPSCSGKAPESTWSALRGRGTAS